jgi:hypothetical protein
MAIDNGITRTTRFPIELETPPTEAALLLFSFRLLML